MIFLDLHKAYDDLDRSRFLEILEGCVVSAPPESLEAADDGGKGGGYYGAAFKGD